MAFHFYFIGVPSRKAVLDGVTLTSSYERQWLTYSLGDNLRRGVFGINGSVSSEYTTLNIASDFVFSKYGL